MSRRRVVVTGMGAITPVGLNVAEAWKNVAAGKSGVSSIQTYDASKFDVRIAADVKDFDYSPYGDAKEARRFDLFILYGVAAGMQAVEDSGIISALSSAGYSRERIGVMMGSGIGGIGTITTAAETLARSGPRRVSPFCIPGAIINTLGGNLSMRYGFRGPNFAVVSACACATHNIGLGFRLICSGDADAMVVGGSEASVHPVPMAAFASMKALSTRNEAPTQASRPWDKDRDGFVLASGAGALVLEDYERAKARGANIYAELAGFGMSADAHHVTSPLPDGSGAMASMRGALEDAGLAPGDVHYINAHGTSTPNGDLAETVAVKKLFGEKVPVSSSKSVFGHMLGAAGAVEGIVAIMSIREGLLPPTINLDNPGEGCDLDYVPQVARPADVSVALSNSFGFGGTNGTLVFRRSP